MSLKNPLSQYEKNIETLENIIQALEEGELTLDAALKQYEKAMGLIRQCQQALEVAEQKIQILNQDNQQENLIPFEHEGVSSSMVEADLDENNDFDDSNIPF